MQLVQVHKKGSTWPNDPTKFGLIDPLGKTFDFGIGHAKRHSFYTETSVSIDDKQQQQKREKN